MLCPKPVTAGTIIGESEEGLAFADQDCGDEFSNCGANAKPLRRCMKYQKKRSLNAKRLIIFAAIFVVASRRV